MPGEPLDGRILVTGGLGYVGRRAVELIVEAGLEVVTYDRDYVPGTERVPAVHGELYDVPRLLGALRDHEVSAIVHTAAVSHPDTSLVAPIATFEANVMGTASLFEAARLAGVRRIVSFSSSSAYGDVNGFVTEDLRLRPITPYGVTKVCVEMLGDVYGHLHGIEVRSLRLFWAYGPGNRMPEHVGDMLRAVRDRNEYRLPNGADHPLPLINIADAAQGTFRALVAEGQLAGVYNIAGPEVVTVGELAELVRRLRPDAEIEIGPGPVPDVHRLPEVDRSAAARDLGYEPRVMVQEGVEEYAAWLEEHPF